MRDWLSHRVVSSPDNTALVRAEDGEAWSYTDLDRLVSETAGRLVAHGVEEGDRLGVLTPPYVGTVGLVHAAMRIGATFVPLSEDLTDRELAERIERADLSAIVCAEPTEGKAMGALETSGVTGEVDVFSVDQPADESVAAVHDLDPEPIDPSEWTFSDRLCILFTSGTTGTPKLVPLTAGNVYSSAVASAFRLGVNGNDRWLVSLALHHMGGLAPVYRSALYGSTLVLREGFDPGGTADDIDSYDVTGVSLVPTMLKRMLERRGTLSDSLRAVLLGGAPASEELLERCRDYSVPVYPTYGMTEAASQIATATPRQTRGRIGTVGRPIFGTDVTIVDEDDTPLDAGENGEIVIDGPSVTPGYFKRESDELDRSDFGPHGLHTGDVGQLDEEGFLYVHNRLDDRIISGGENVEPGEVSDVLREFPDVEDAAVVGLDDEVWGERVSALIAVGEGYHQSDLVGGHAGESGFDESDIGGSDIADGEEGQDGEENDGNGDNDNDDEDGAAESDETETPNEHDDVIDGESDDDDPDVDESADGESDDEESPAVIEGAPVNDAKLLSFARDRLAGFKIPKTVAYIDELPRTVSGTIDRDAVREVLREHGYDPRSEMRSEFETAGFEPADPADPDEPVESVLVETWLRRSGTDDGDDGDEAIDDGDATGDGGDEPSDDDGDDATGDEERDAEQVE